MWWTEEEEQLQKQAEAAWGAPADDGIADLADQLAVGVALEGDDADMGEDGPPPVFPWHVPEGAPPPEPAGPFLANGHHHGLPFLNGHHPVPLINGHHHGPPLLHGHPQEWDDIEDDLGEAMPGPMAAFHPPDNFPG
jgi:hypothetical protein